MKFAYSVNVTFSVPIYHCLSVGLSFYLPVRLAVCLSVVMLDSRADFGHCVGGLDGSWGSGALVVLEPRRGHVLDRRAILPTV